jgi:hypothetical protein
VFLRMPILTGVARQALPNAPLTTDGHKHTYTRHPLPDLYLQNTCKFAVKSALLRGAIDKLRRGSRTYALRAAWQAASRTGKRLGEGENLCILYFTLRMLRATQVKVLTYTAETLRCSAWEQGRNGGLWH